MSTCRNVKVKLKLHNFGLQQGNCGSINYTPMTLVNILVVANYGGCDQLC